MGMTLVFGTAYPERNYPKATCRLVRMKVFLSYRRDDFDGHGRTMARAVRSCFKELDPSINVYVDDNLSGGANWEDELLREVATCNVCMVLIGPQWQKLFDRKNSSKQRDIARLELETAIKRSRPVLPVFLDTKAPDPQRLPKMIGAKVTEIQGIEVRESHLPHDITKVLSRVRRTSI